MLRIATGYFFKRDVGQPPLVGEIHAAATVVRIGSSWDYTIVQIVTRQHTNHEDARAELALHLAALGFTLATN